MKDPFTQSAVKSETERKLDTGDCAIHKQKIRDLYVNFTD